MICPSRRIGFALLTSLLMGRGAPARSAGTRREFFNRSRGDWRLILVEGTRTSAGRLQLIDKFSGNRVATLAKVGDSVALPAGARYLVEFSYDNKAFFHDFIVQDGHGHYAEFVASVSFQSDPAPALSYKDRRVGPPLDRATDEAVLRMIEDAIATEQGNLIIQREFICPELPAPPE